MFAGIPHFNKVSGGSSNYKELASCITKSYNSFSSTISELQKQKDHTVVLSDQFKSDEYKELLGFENCDEPVSCDNPPQLKEFEAFNFDHLFFFHHYKNYLYSKVQEFENYNWTEFQEMKHYYVEGEENIVAQKIEEYKHKIEIELTVISKCDRQVK